MKQVQQDIVKAIRCHSNVKSGSANSSGYALRDGLTGDRDKLSWYRDEFRYELWSHGIAFGNAADKKLYVSTCGYNTATTVSRLNAIFAGFDIPMAAVIRKKSTVFTLNGQDIDSSRNKRVSAGAWSVMFM